MKSVINTIVIFVGLYIIASSGIMDLLMNKYISYIACGSIVAMLLLTIAIIGTPFSKPFIKIKRRGDAHDDKNNLS